MSASVDEQLARAMRPAPSVQAPPQTPPPRPQPARPAQSKPSPEPPSTWADLAKLIGPVTWHWERWLAPGFVHLLASKSGLGKSTLAMRLAACYVAGWPWPDGTPFENDRGLVLWLETENAQALNLDRAQRWGLPLDGLLNPFTDPLAELRLADQAHRRAIAERAARPDVRLIVLDSLSGGWAGRDENDARLLELMKWLAGLARDVNKPFVVTHHLRKRSQADVDGELDLDQLRGSSAVVQVARLVWALDRPNRTDTTMRLQVLKSNLARYPPPLSMAIDADGGVAFTDNAPGKPTRESQAQTAEAWLLTLLTPGPVAARDVLERAEAENIAKRTLERAKEALAVETRKTSRGWVWNLPDVETASQLDIGGLGDVGALGGLGGLGNVAKDAKDANIHKGHMATLNAPESEPEGVTLRPWADGPKRVEISRSRVQEIMDSTGCSRGQAESVAAYEADVGAHDDAV